MADISEKVAGHSESLGADEILLQSAQVEKIDTVARVLLDWTARRQAAGLNNLNVLCGGRAVAPVAQKNE